MSDKFGMPEVDMRPAFEQIESLRQQLADVKVVSDHNLKVYQDAAESLRQQLVEARAENSHALDSYMLIQQQLADAKNESAAFAQLADQRFEEAKELQKRGVMLRDALKEVQTVAESSVKTHGYDKQHVRNADVAKRALAATDDLKGVILCHAKPMAWTYDKGPIIDVGAKIPLYRAWDPK